MDTEAFKKTRRDAQFLPKKIATAQGAAAVDKHPPFLTLEKTMDKNPKDQKKGESVVYWMRMQDMRSKPLTSDQFEYQH